jgi:hypothetical protein
VGLYRNDWLCVMYKESLKEGMHTESFLSTRRHNLVGSGGLVSTAMSPNPCLYFLFCFWIASYASITDRENN